MVGTGVHNRFKSMFARLAVGVVNLHAPPGQQSLHSFLPISCSHLDHCDPAGFNEIKSKCILGPIGSRATAESWCVLLGMIVGEPTDCRHELIETRVCSMISLEKVFTSGNH